MVSNMDQTTTYEFYLTLDSLYSTVTHFETMGFTHAPGLKS